MPKPATFDTVRKIALALPGVEECVSWGAPTLKVHGKLLACVPTHRSAEPGSLVVRLGPDDRAALLAEAPDVYYITATTVATPACWYACLALLPDVLRDLLGMAHKFVTRDSKPRPSTQAPNSLN